MHPYKTLPPSSFWKTAISEHNYLDFFDIYKKKFAIAANHRIVTAGSCFAQHIAKRLQSSGFKYFSGLRTGADGIGRGEIRQKHGYEIYSARYNNIYTARQLLQTFQRAFGQFTPAERIWSSGDRVFDPFRPTVGAQRILLPRTNSLEASCSIAISRPFGGYSGTPICLSSLLV